MSNRGGFVVLLLVCFSGSAFAQSTLARSVIDRFYTEQNILNTSAQYRLDEQLMQVQPDGTTKIQKAQVYVHNPQTTMVVLQYPDQKPSIFLKTSRGSWFYKQGLRTPLRIRDSFKIFAAANLADILGINLRSDFAIESTSTSGGVLTIHLRRTNRAVPYSSAVVEAGIASQDLQSIALVGQDGVALKEVTLSDYREVSGTHRLPTWTINDLLFTGEGKTIIRYVAVDRTNVPASLYQPNGSAMRRFLSVVQF